MPPIGPIRRNDLVRYFRMLGFDGPYPGGKHEFMIKGTIRVAIPNPHRGDIAKGLLLEILRQAGIDRESWEELR
ncbi:MAG TPA: type II toxin-antitoxin system HicA family toxin [Chloroflexia bacterium]|nr:type II toxin-antitoxin system HicA family toxin [Chloroflexia bacterium]